MRVTFSVDGNIIIAKNMTVIPTRGDSIYINNKYYPVIGVVWHIEKYLVNIQLGKEIR